MRTHNTTNDIPGMYSFKVNGKTVVGVLVYKGEEEVCRLRALVVGKALAALDGTELVDETEGQIALEPAQTTPQPKEP